MCSVYTLLIIKRNNDTSFFLFFFDGPRNVRNGDMSVSEYLTRAENYRRFKYGSTRNSSNCLEEVTLDVCTSIQFMELNLICIYT